MDPADAVGEGHDRPAALAALNSTLSSEGYDAFYAEDGQCYLRHVPTKTIAKVHSSPHRPFSVAEQKKREQLAACLNKISEDELIEEILLPLFRQLGFHRITASGHKDKRWNMAKIFGCNTHCRLSTSFTSASKQKFGKLDSAGASKNANVAEIHNQVLMMLAHEVFDPEIGKRVLIDHAFIVAGGEITKAARNWLGNALDARKRSQLLFLDRDDTLNLFIVNSVPLPVGALPPEPNFWWRLIFHFDGVPVPASQLSSKQDVSAHASATWAATILARVLFLPGEWSIRRLFPSKDGASPKGLCSLAVATSVAVCDRT